jgi:Ca2+/Na+ antiporter
MKTLIKIRFIPLIVGLMVLFLGLFLHFVLQNGVGMRIVKWGIGLSFVGFIFLQAVREKVREKKEKEENPQLQQKPEIIREEKKKDEIYNIKNRNIPISLVRLFFCILLILMGINLIFSNKEYLFGLIILLVGLCATAFSVMWTMKWFKLWKKFTKNDVKQ